MGNILMSEKLKVISLGAGVQSTTLFLMSCLGKIDKADVAIFADTQGEPPEVYKHLLHLTEMGEKYGIPVHVVSKGDLESDTRNYIDGQLNRAASIPFFLKTERKGGGRAWRQCTSEYKIEPVRREARRVMKEHGLKKVEMWIGISTDEIQRAKDSNRKYITNVFPLLDLGMSRTDCKRWIESMDQTVPSKSACYYCPYRKDSEWKRMKIEDPELFQKAVDFDKSIRKNPKMNADQYLHRSKVPLDEVDFDTKDNEDYGFLGECEGMCGL